MELNFKNEGEMNFRNELENEPRNETGNEEMMEMNTENSMEMNFDDHEGVIQLTNDGFIGVHSNYCEDYNTHWLRVTRKMVRECQVGDIFQPEIPKEQYTNLTTLTVTEKNNDYIVFHQLLKCNVPFSKITQVWELKYSLKTFEKISQTLLEEKRG